jgi:4-diphosphocytidyl-2-C-methyl-D-erythritol kinase
VEGKGERVEPLSAWPELYAVLVNPRLPVATAEVFARYDAGDRTKPHSMRLPLGLTGMREAVTLIRHGTNDLEPPARAIQPAIGEALAVLEQEGSCLLARMSGSGASCFGLYESQQAAAQAAARMSQARPDWWVRATRLSGCDRE